MSDRGEGSSADTRGVKEERALCCHHHTSAGKSCGQTAADLSLAGVRLHTHTHTHTRPHTHTPTHTHTHRHTPSSLCSTLYKTKPPAPQTHIYLPLRRSGCVSVSMNNPSVSASVSVTSQRTSGRGAGDAALLWVGVGWGFSTRYVTAPGFPPPHPPSCWGWCFHVLWETVAWRWSSSRPTVH